jgi:DNA-3-methyladenine glycosylase
VANRRDPWRALRDAAVEASASALLGCTVTAYGVTVRLTEVEAYAGVGIDPASHAYRGRTPRNGVMFGPAGFLYVYFTYGMHWCMNVVTGPPGAASAGLLRAGEVVDGVDTARKRRTGPSGRIGPDRELARGPARLAMALGVTGADNGAELLSGTDRVALEPPPVPVDPATVRFGPRVGVAGGADTPWRFWLDGEPTVSSYRRHVPRNRQPDVSD